LFVKLEVRRYWITEELGTLSETARWKGLRSIGPSSAEDLYALDLVWQQGRSKLRSGAILAEICGRDCRGLALTLLLGLLLAPVPIGSFFIGY
jgi:hypothetical protein